MTLRIDLKDESASAQINRWAAQMEATQATHVKQLATINQYVTQLHQLNPNLVRPNLNK